LGLARLKTTIGTYIDISYTKSEVRQFELDKDYLSDALKTINLDSDIKQKENYKYNLSFNSTKFKNIDDLNVFWIVAQNLYTNYKPCFKLIFKNDTIILNVRDSYHYPRYGKFYKNISIDNNRYKMLSDDNKRLVKEIYNSIYSEKSSNLTLSVKYTDENQQIDLLEKMIDFSNVSLDYELEFDIEHAKEIDLYDEIKDWAVGNILYVYYDSEINFKRLIKDLVDNKSVV
jgi:hypothetical protein